MKKLTQVEVFLLENEGPNYKSFWCPTHGLYQVPKSASAGMCVYSMCTERPNQIEDAKAYLAAQAT